ncbi:Gfo/Idh/MocA family protein [Paenibacillus jiagnxiensis]|uniref:Gfo/Idh/MocA family protein n=1 Tax=Paenibacillus jiagnxiensis TaxID=3228926 RepID=UPI0033A36B52
MKIGIISFAHMHAYSYASALQKLDGAVLAGIADDNAARGKQFAETFGTQLYTDYHELLQQDIEGVIVTSENVNHKEHVIAAAKAGKHVLCEKPLATNVEDALEMIEVCRQHGVILQTAFPVRYNSSIVRAKEMIDEGGIGRILAMRGTNRGQNPGGWFVEPALSGGGAVMDHTVHVVDIMRWFTGYEVKEVYAEIDTHFSDTPIDDCGILTMEFEHGIFATLDCSWSRNKTFPTWGDVTLEIVGSEGTISIDALDQKLHVHTDQHGYRHSFWGDDMDEGLIAGFVRAIREGKAPITGEDGMRAVEVALAAYQSARIKEPVATGL